MKLSSIYQNQTLYLTHYFVGVPAGNKASGLLVSLQLNTPGFEPFILPLLTDPLKSGLHLVCSRLVPKPLQDCLVSVLLATDTLKGEAPLQSPLFSSLEQVFSKGCSVLAAFILHWAERTCVSLCRSRWEALKRFYTLMLFFSLCHSFIAKLFREFLRLHGCFFCPQTECQKYGFTDSSLSSRQLFHIQL